MLPYGPKICQILQILQGKIGNELRKEKKATHEIRVVVSFHFSVIKNIM